MSDYCLYEVHKAWKINGGGMLEDTFWNDFVQTDDHIVPHPGHEYETDPELKGNSYKRTRRDVVGVISHVGESSTSKFVGQPKEDRSFQSLENIKDTMLDKESWSQTPKGAFSASHDNDATQKMTPHCFQSSNESAISSDTYSYPLAEMSPTENDLSFLDNDHDYGWPEIENFEDVDRLFRSCDSTFGIHSIGNGNELSWFSSSHNVEGSEDVLNSDFKFSSESSPFKATPEQYEASKLKHSQLVDNSNAEAGSVPQSSVVNEPSVSHHMTFMNGGLKPEVQELESNGNLQFKETKIPSVIHQVYISPDVRMQKQSIGSDPNSYLQNHVNYMHLDYGDLSNQIPVNSTTSGARSKYPKESSNHPEQSFENYHDRLLETPETKMDKKGKRLQYRLGLHSSSMADANHVNASDPSAAFDLKSAHKKQVHKLQNELENHGEIDGVSFGRPAEVDSLYVQESSLESGLDDISLEASSFRQLQQVTEKLDIRTKMCIRDSLYRLARSAEQRNNQETLHGSCDGMHATGKMVVEGTNNSFADMETDTNPIDRSIAHLLFHRPPDPSLMPRQDGVSGESYRTIHGSTTAGPSIIPDKQIFHEETAIEIDKAICHQ